MDRALQVDAESRHWRTEDDTKQAVLTRAAESLLPSQPRIVASLWARMVLAAFQHRRGSVSQSGGHFAVDIGCSIKPSIWWSRKSNVLHGNEDVCLFSGERDSRTEEALNPKPGDVMKGRCRACSGLRCASAEAGDYTKQMTALSA
eukprot:2709357-Amphidinium_carterae.3